MEEKDLNLKAKAIPYEERRRIITSFSELEIQKYLKELFQSMEPNYLIEVTQGNREFGKDLVLV